MLITLMTYASFYGGLVKQLPSVRSSQCQTAVGIGPLSCSVRDVCVGAGLVICPSRELAKQTHDIITHYCTGLPQEIRCCLAIGGIPVSESMEIISRSVLFEILSMLSVTCSWGLYLHTGVQMMTGNSFCWNLVQFESRL